MFFELREYRVLPGQIENWVRFFEEEVLPYQTSKGVEFIGSFRGENDPETFVWLRRFASEAERERIYKEIYEDDRWKKELSPRVPSMLDRSAQRITRLEATPHSQIQ